MRYLIFTCLFFSLQISSQQKFLVGEITSKISVNNSKNETFELYLPSKYNSKKENAIIFIFDPSGIGKIGIKPFIPAAEDFNYILVCSNNAKNGPYQINFEIANRLFAHVFSVLNIDEKQIYTAGFSGGSRLASSIAVLTNSIQGVIGCGAGFANQARVFPNTNNKFSYVGLVGDEDMNYHEMLDLKLWLNKININNELFTYQDGHRWPHTKQIKRAVGWLELQSYKKGIRKVDEKIVKSLFLDDLKYANQIKQKQPYNSVVEYNRILKSYTDYYNLDSISDKISFLKKRKDFKKEIKLRKKIKQREIEIFDLLHGEFKKELTFPRPTLNSKWWNKEIKKLDKTLIKSKSIFTSKMVKRVRYRIFAAAIEGSNNFIRNNQIRKALYCDSLVTLLKPKTWWAYYRLAKSYARVNQFNEVITSLKKAIDLGLNDINILLKTKEFNSYHEKNEFKELLK